MLYIFVVALLVSNMRWSSPWLVAATVAAGVYLVIT